MTAVALHLPPLLETSNARSALFGFPAAGEGTATSFEAPMLAEARQFLRTLTNEEHITAAAETNASQMLREIFRASPGLGRPRIAPGFDGLVGMTWQNDAYHVNVEVFSDGHVEFFFEDLRSGELWEEELKKVATPPPSALARLRRLESRK